MERKMAYLLVDYCLEAKEGEVILIEASEPAIPLLREIHKAVLERGAFPQIQIEFSGQDRLFYERIGVWGEKIPSTKRSLAESSDKYLRIQSQQNPLELAEIDPKIIANFQRTNRPLQDLRLSKPWCLTLYPTSGYAQQAGMSTQTFRDFVFDSMYLGFEDPVKKWGEISALNQKVIERFEKAAEVRIEGPATDLTLNVKGRTWRNSDGKRNMPSGEVFTAPLESSANGHVTFNIPSVVSGKRVEEVFLRFQDGKVVESSAKVGNEFLTGMLESDAGARFLGEIGIGTNFGITNPSGLILFDEKIGGSIHLALGRSYPETGGLNKSAIHWDLILDLRQGGAIWLDGELVQRDGRFIFTNL